VGINQEGIAKSGRPSAENTLTSDGWSTKMAGRNSGVSSRSEEYNGPLFDIAPLLDATRNYVCEIRQNAECRYSGFETNIISQKK
jgi:hypothetical protein